MASDYYAIKFKLNTIVNDPKLLVIINNWVLKENKIIFEAMNLLNNYIFYCLDNNLSIQIDTTLIRQCCMLIINPKNKIGRIKTNFAKPDLTDKTEEEIIIINKKYDDTKENYKKKGEINKARVEPLKLAFDKYFPKDNIEVFKNESGITIPIELFSNTFFANIENHLQLNYFKFQLRYLICIVKNKLLAHKLDDYQISTISRYIQKCITLNENIDFICNDKFPELIFSKIKKNVKKIINEQIKLILIKRSNYADLKITAETSMYYKKSYEQTNLKSSNNEVIKYFAIMSKYLCDYKEKSFSIIPQISLGYQHITFDERIMSDIYNEWKSEKITRKVFMENYTKYFNEMFNINIKSKKFYKKGYIPKVLSTDGYSVSVMFTIKKKDDIKNKKNAVKVKKTVKKKALINEVEKVNLSTLNKGIALKNGMYDADKIICSEEYLKLYHKKGVDSGNKYMIAQVSEAERSTIITKGYYNEISHINLNKRKIDKFIKEDKMDEIYKELSETTRQTTNNNMYNKYVLLMRKHNKLIWAFYGRDDVRELKYDTYINKRSAICKIVRELVPGVKGGKKRKHKNKKNKKNERGEQRKHKKDEYFDAYKHKKVKELPTMIAFGKGNGSLTINNTKGCSSHGPIKRIVNALSKVCLVILTNEDYSSQMCCKCEHKLTHTKVIEDINNKKIKKEEDKKKEYDTYKTKMERIEEGKKLRTEIKEETNIKTKKEKEKRMTELKVEYQCYKLCCCKNKECGHKLWHRDINAAKNMITIMIRQLTNKPLGVFEKKK